MDGCSVHLLGVAASRMWQTVEGGRHDQSITRTGNTCGIVAA